MENFDSQREKVEDYLEFKEEEWEGESSEESESDSEGESSEESESDSEGEEEKPTRIVIEKKMEDYYPEFCELENEPVPGPVPKPKEEKEFLFPRKLEEVCSCHECCTDIGALKGFEKELISNLKLVEGCKLQLYNSEQRCETLAVNIAHLIYLFNFLYGNLKQVYKGLGLSTLDRRDRDWVIRLKSVYLSMNLKLFGHKRNMKPYDYYQVCGKKGGDADTIRKKIAILLKRFKRSLMENKAHELLNKILDIENQHERDKQSAAKASSLDPSVSKMYIEKQIELLKEFPFEEVEWEMNVILDKMSPCKDNQDLLEEVRLRITGTRFLMFQTSIMFLEEHHKIKGHGSSGLEKTLDSLTNQMKLFTCQWKKDYFPSIFHIITLCQQAEAEGFCPHGLCPRSCRYHC